MTQPTEGAGTMDLQTTTPAVPAVTGDRAERARARTAAIRMAFEVGLQGLAESLAEGDWQALGYESPVTWFETEFGDLRMVKLDRPTFKALAGAYVAEGHSTRTAAEKLGVSASAVSSATRDVPRPEKTKSRDGRERTTTHLRAVPDAPTEVLDAEVVAEVAEPVRVQPLAQHLQAAALVALSGDAGLTVKELARATEWHHGIASGALSRARRQGLLVASTLPRRGGCTPWLAVV